MEKETFYSAPESEVVAFNKYAVFGGWLRFYQLMNIIVLLMVVLVFGIVSAGYFVDVDDINSIDLLLSGLETTPGIILSILVLKLLSEREPETPQKITKYIGYYLILSLLVYAFVYYQFVNGYASEKPASFFGDIIYYFIWTSYFKKSKRVLTYYGANAV